MKNINPIYTKSWKLLKKHFLYMKHTRIIDLFNQDKNRFLYFSKNFNNQILIDYSKNLITKKTINILINLALECNVPGAISAMFRGDKINCIENRAVLHTALRDRKNTSILIDGHNIMPKINTVLEKMKKFCSDIIQGKRKGFTNKNITDVVSIGIGGSHLGPYMVTEALKPYKNHLNIHFISNIDGTNIIEVLKNLNPETTLFLIISKSFSTQETITNANSARNWFLQTTSISNRIHISKHFIALSANSEAVKNFGLDPENNMFEFWEWVGGRFSIWSSAGLPIMLSLGANNFDELLNGAHEMDLHFKYTPLNENLPILLALIGIWYNNFFLTETEAIFPYDQYMHRFTSYLQQSNMESNGKYIDRNGISINYQTGPIIWGESGTNGQHSFYQLMHQGTKMIPCDFIAPIISHNPISNHHDKLISNFLAQTKALAFGENLGKFNQESIISKNYNNNSNKKINLYKTIKGNQPSNSILIRKITPYTLGALIALYEHKIFTQGIIFNIYSFDQWGVELGKQLADHIYSSLLQDNKTCNYDSSTNGLIKYYKSWNHS